MSLWVDTGNMEKGLRFEDDTTVLIGRFMVSSWEGDTMGNWTPRTISYHANFAARQSFKNYDKALTWCRGFRWGVKVEREFVTLPAHQIIIPEWQYYPHLTRGYFHEVLIRWKFKRMKDAFFFKLKWWPSA